jgi:PhnB protein
MASDSPPGNSAKMQGISVALHPKEPAEAERLFDALSDGGQVTMPLDQTFWAQKFGMLTDRFGTPWMINCSKPI